MSTDTGYLETCCWTYIQQHCPWKERQDCACRCHSEDRLVPDLISTLQRHVGHAVSFDTWVTDLRQMRTQTIRAVNRGWVMFEPENGKIIPDLYIYHIRSFICYTCVKENRNAERQVEADAAGVDRPGAQELDSPTG